MKIICKCFSTSNFEDASHCASGFLSFRQILEVTSMSSMGTDDVMATPSSGSTGVILAARLESLCHGNGAAPRLTRGDSIRRNENENLDCVLPLEK